MQFYQLNKNSKGETINYSTDFNFFLQHQVTIINHQQGRSYNSRLEAKNFVEMGNFEANRVGDNNMPVLKYIHTKILEGKFGEGKIVN